jgi:hypothetical protein
VRESPCIRTEAFGGAVAETRLDFSSRGQERPGFYECIALSEVARFNPGPNRAVTKEIAILFEYNQEHTLLYKRWLGDMDVELILTEPRTVTSSLGRPVETRQIAIIPLPPGRKGGEPVVIGARVVQESTWSKKAAPAIKNLRDRFISRPTISMTHTARKPRLMDLVVGWDNRKIFPELAQEACHIGDDFVLHNILFSPGQVIYGPAQKSIRWTDNLEDPEEAMKPQFKNRAKGKKKARGKERPAEARIVRRVSVEISAGQSPHHGLQDDVYEAEGGSSYRGDTPISFVLEADLPETVIQREVRTAGDPDFCQHRNVVVLPESGEPAAVEAEEGEGLGRGWEVIDLPEAEGPALESVAEFLGHAIDISMQETDERNVQDELPVLRLEEPPNEWERDSNDGDEAVGEARGQTGPAQATTVEQRMEEYLRVATPDIPALFPRPAWDLSFRLDASAGDMARHMDDYGAEYLKQDQAEAEFRARREEAKVWRRKRDEDLRRVLEARALQGQKWGEDLARRVDVTMEKEEEERRAEERRVREAEREKLEDQKRNEERQQLEEKRREAEKRKKEEKKRREEEKRATEEQHRKRMKVVEAATAQAKEKKKRRDEQKELKARVDAEEYKLFLVKEAEREKMLAEEAKEQLAKKSEEADRARMAKAERTGKSCRRGSRQKMFRWGHQPSVIGQSKLT